MPSLHQLVADHAPLLVLDAASARVQTGWIEREASRWASCEDEAGVGLFRALDELAVDPNAARGFVFCEGPGSILGIRTTAMAIRTWNVLQPRPAFTFASLALVAQALGRDDTAVIADARRNLWHHFQIGGTLRRLPAVDLPGTLVMPEGFRHWSPLPDGVTRVPYALGDLFARAAEADIFRAAEAPDAFLHEEPSYVTWTPQIHRAGR